MLTEEFGCVATRCDVDAVVRRLPRQGRRRVRRRGGRRTSSGRRAA